MVYENQSTKSDLVPILLGVSAVTAIIFGGMIVSYNSSNHDDANVSSLQQQVHEAQNNFSQSSSRAGTPNTLESPLNSTQAPAAPLAQNKAQRHRV